MLRKPLSASVLLVVVVSFMLGCGEHEKEKGKWNMPIPIITGVDPSVGNYSFSSQGCFRVIVESGKKYVVFAPECWRSEKIAVLEGVFYYEWGAIGGTHCPTDGFAISGQFDSPKIASGTIKYASDCRIYKTENFKAVFKE